MSASPSDADDWEGRLGVPALSADSSSTNNKRGRDDLGNNALMIDGRVDELGQTQLEGSHSGTSKRKRYVPSSSTAQYQIFHEVICHRGGFHVKHEKLAHYLDSPKLFAGDSKGNVLRGKERVVIEDYMEGRSDIAFIVYRLYDCNSYHDEVEDDFDRLPMPPIDPDVISRLKAYFFSLRVEGQNAKPVGETIQIESPNLTRAISEAEAAIGRTLVDFGPSTNTHLIAPYLPFYHTREILNKLVSDCDTSGRDYLALLFNFMAISCGQEWSAADAVLKNGMIEETHLSKLFRPGDVVVEMVDSQPRGYQIETCTLIPNSTSLELKTTSWTFDEGFRKEKIDLDVYWPPGDDRIPITKLDIYPLQYDTSGLEERLRKRGEQFWKCRKRAFVGYDYPNPRLEVQPIVPRYMVDDATYRELHSSDRDPSADEDDLGQEVMDSNNPPEDPFLLLLPETIRGFGMHDKKWKELSVEHIRPVQWNKDAFERHLVLKPQKKELIKALVTVHMASSSSSTTDIIEGKGRGLIILLHGGPGTGKTLTAESVAELAERPLYRVTCGDMGTDAESVEKYLNSVLHIGTIWGCVVLLDEADVFLEERSQMDLQRNALVSVFLRVLEYYDGILILTSNRVGTFDEAFKSRVQLAMHYPSLDENGRWEIWRNFVNVLKDEGDSVNYEELKDKLDILARHKLNGRQIRNSVSTARQLAKYRKEKLAYSHFDQAIDVTNEFEEYVLKTHGHDDEEWARSQRTRY